MNFCNLADLNQKGIRLISPFVSSMDNGIIGTDYEKEHYNLIEKIMCNVLEYNNLVDVYTKIDAIKWSISERRVQKFCEENRIQGVAKFSYIWMIRKDAEKPIDIRYKV